MKIKTVTIVDKQISPEGAFITAKDLFNRADPSKRNRTDWINKHQLFVCDMYVYTPVMISFRLFWLAAITGSLYDNQGQCQSGTNSIDLALMYRNDEQAKEILLSKPII